MPTERLCMPLIGMDLIERGSEASEGRFHDGGIGVGGENGSRLRTRLAGRAPVRPARDAGPQHPAPRVGYCGGDTAAAAPHRRHHRLTEKWTNESLASSLFLLLFPRPTFAPFNSQTALALTRFLHSTHRSQLAQGGHAWPGTAEFLAQHAPAARPPCT